MSKFKFELGKNNVLREGLDVAIMACGIMVKLSLDAAEVLKKIIILMQQL